MLSWHPGESALKIAGGFTRAYEIVKRTNQPLVILDKHPSLFSELAGSKVRILEYAVPSFNFLNPAFPLINKLIDRFLTPFGLLSAFYRHKLSPTQIYVPYSELPQLTLTGVVLKFLTKSKLILCNLNVNSLFLDRVLNVFLHRLSDKTITISRNLADQLKKTGIFCQFINGVGFDISIYKQNYMTDKKYDAIFIGRHTPEKGIVDLIKIWNVLVNKLGHKYTLVTAGDIPGYMSDHISSLINQYKLDRLIKLCGKVSELEKTKLLKTSRLCVFPSRQEGWGIVPMEALASGLPVVAYNLPVYLESIGNSSGFMMVKVGDLLGFAQKTEEVLANINKYSLLAKKWRPKQTWESVSRKEFEVICA